MSEDIQYKLRLPSALHGRLAEMAKLNNRSLSSEIVARLESTLQGGVDNNLTLQMLTTEVDRLTQELRDVRGSNNQLMEKVTRSSKSTCEA